jgi:twinfilin-like protein
VPYRAKEEARNLLLQCRHKVVRQLDKGYISFSMVCKEIAEITDSRSWVEREAEATPLDTASTGCDNKESCNCVEHCGGIMKDVGYRRNKCRLCDRRMKNKISSETLKALTVLQAPGTAVQIVWHPPRDVSLVRTLTHSSSSTLLPKLSSWKIPSTTYSQKTSQRCFQRANPVSCSTIIQPLSYSISYFIRPTAPQCRNA